MKVHELDVHPALPERLAWLGEIARNVWTSWNPEAQDLFARLDPEAWEALGQNPVALLRRLPQERLDAAAADEGFVAMVARVARRLDAYANGEGWFPGAHPDAASMRVAYFSLEFGLRRRHPHLLGRPRRPRRRPPQVGQRPRACRWSASACSTGAATSASPSTPDGWQHERYPATDWDDLPLADQPGRDGRAGGRRGAGRRRDRARGGAGASRSAGCRCSCSTPTSTENAPEARDITGDLYGGDREMRIRQEILLGIGGVRALAAARHRADGLPHERGPLRVPRPRADPRRS